MIKQVLTASCSVLFLSMACWTSGFGSEVSVTDLKVAGRIAGEGFTFELTLKATATRVGARVPIVVGDAVLLSAAQGDGWRLGHDTANQSYVLTLLGGAEPVTVTASFVAKAEPEEGNPYWHTSTVDIPAAHVRRVEILAERADLELELPGTLQQQRETREGTLVASGVLVPGQPLCVRWKAQVETVEAKLLVASEANTIMALSHGALRVDGVFVYAISQGKLNELHFKAPDALSITQVRGEHIRDWHMETADGAKRLVVHLNREQDRQYRLQVLGEMALPPYPTEADIPVIEPLDGTRADGYLAIGTNSAIQLQVKQSTGLSQVDAAAFPRVALDPKQPRPIPQTKTFYYSFAATPYQMHVALADIVPSFDADERLVVTVRDDDLLIDAAVEVEVRDAPIRRLTVALPVGFVVAGVTGQQVSDHTVTAADADVPGQLVIDFHEPVLGRALVELKLEMGKSPIGLTQAVDGLSLPEARNERGFIAVVSDRGVLIDGPQSSGLRQVHTRSIPMRVADAQFAWRFREKGWSLSLPIKERPASMRAEAFHLLSLGDGVAYGNIALTYVIAGAPIDELRFRVAPELKDVEFVGLDVSRWTEQDGIWTVKLRQKVIGDYNLGITFTQRYEDGGQVLAGGVSCEDVETQTGFITIASHRDVQLSEAASDASLIPIGHDETPSHYRLLVSASLLRSYKYVKTPHTLSLRVQAHARGTTPAVIVEFINANTQFSIDDTGRSESVTRVRYTVKNSSAQFLDVRVPDEIKIWTTHVVRKDSKGQELRTRVAAARDQGLLKVPLTRQRNPNAPLTVELEYGQVHGKLGWRGDLLLNLPACLVRSTYADWCVTAPADWSVYAGKRGSMGTTSRSVSPLQFACRIIAAGWLAAFRGAAVAVAAVVMGIFAVAALLLRRRWLTTAVVVLIGLLLVWQGVRASRVDRAVSRAMTPQHTAVFTQVLDLDENTPLSVDVRVVPTWRSHMSVLSTLVLLLVAAAACGRAWRGRKGRAAFLAIAVTGIVLVLLQFEAGMHIAVHVLTWGIPVALLLGVAGRAAGGALRGRRPGMAALLLLVGALACVPSGSQAAGAKKRAASTPKPAVPVLVERQECALVVQKDSVLADLSMTIDSEDGVQLAIAPASILLLAAPTGSGPASVVSTGASHILEVASGRHDLKLTLLFPLPPESEDQARRFQMPLVPALSARLSVSIPATDLDLELLHAVGLQSVEAEGATTLSARLSPGRDVDVSWKPRGRRTRLEETVFYVELTGVARADSGLVEVLFGIDLRVAQGEVSKLELAMPETMTVTRVAGEKLGSWRFDPASRRLHVGFDQPITGDHVLTMSTQITASAMPYTASIGSPVVADALRQRGILGLLSSSAVNATIGTHPQPMNIDDYRRIAGALLTTVGEAWGTDVLHAYRIADPKASVTVAVTEVRPELRTTENASFSVADERLVYNGTHELDVTKAGVFSVDVRLPAVYDIDSLTCEGMSHWDEDEVQGRRIARLHFQKRLLGQASINLALSQAIAEVPAVLEVPRVGVEGVLKHRGQLIVSAERGVRLSVAERDGVSELDVAQQQLRDKPALAFKLLRPEWSLRLQSETLTPRVNVEFLHLANVSDGLVRHKHYLRYRLQNAGAKVFEIAVPTDALGLVLSGPEIARKELVDPETSRWRVELSGKWFDRPYPLQLTYETRFSTETGDVPIHPVQAVGADLQRGYIVVRTSARVELVRATIGPMLQVAEARSVPSKFGAGELADAAFCYTSPASDYELSFKAARHDAADLLQAEVLRTELVSVISRQLDGIHQVKLTLRAGGKRHLRVELPRGSRIWALLVDRQSRTPSFAGADDVLLIPLPQSTGGELTVAVDLICVVPRPPQASMRRHDYTGPKFDLPLRNISWMFYVPTEYLYDDFGGTLTPDENLIGAERISAYDLGVYEAETLRVSNADLQKAVQLQQQGLMLAKGGNQKDARQALMNAFNYSVADKSLNEDARVNLRNLLKQQAVVGLVQRRGDVRQEAQQPAGADVTQLGESFTQEEAERLQSSLSKADSENLELITNRMIEIQEAAAGVTLQLMVKAPLHGRMLMFTRPLQVEPNSEMRVSFSATPKPRKQWSVSLLCTLAMFLVFVFLVKLPSMVAGGLSRPTHVAAPGPGPAAEDGAGADPAAEAEAGSSAEGEPPSV